METESSYDYDIFVIGGGSGGIAAAKEAKALGQKVALADFVRPSPQNTTWGLGGTCVNVGCIPKKMMHYISSMGEQRSDMKEVGFQLDPEAPHDWEQMMDKVNGHVRSLNFGYRSQMIKSKIDYFNSFAVLKDKHTVLLTDKSGKQQEKTANNILISVGGRPNYLNVPGAKEYCQTSDDIFWARKPYGKTLVIGAGYIALECGGFLHGLGKDVTILYRSQILRNFDQQMAQKLLAYMKKIGMKFSQGNATKFEMKDEKIICSLEIMDNNGEMKSHIEEYDNVFMAIGRTPETSKIGLVELGVKYDKYNKIIVNEKWQSSVDNIYAIGDVRNDSVELTPVAIKEGQFLMRGLVKNQWKTIEYEKVATTVFTPLEYSKCGLNEEDAISRYGEDNIDVYHTVFKPLEWNVSWDHDADCYAKIIILRKERTVLGIHYLGPNAGEVMSGYSLAVRCNLKYEDIEDTIGIHPTTGEELVRMKVTKREQPEVEYSGC